MPSTASTPPPRAPSSWSASTSTATPPWRRCALGSTARWAGSWRSSTGRSPTAPGSGSRPAARTTASGPSTTGRRTARARGATWPFAATGRRRAHTASAVRKASRRLNPRPARAITMVMGAPRPAEIPTPTVADWSAAIQYVLDEPELIRPVFQPIVDLETGAARGYETLARFVSPIRATPPEWLAQAAARGVGPRLEAMLVEIGLDALARVPDNCFLTINISPSALDSDEVAQLLAARESLEGVVIEVTEQAVVEDYARLEYILRSLRAAGAAIAVDDAGAGYASLHHVVALRPQFVKLDRSLVADLDRDDAKLAVIESLITFSSRIDAWIVAEGIERAEEMAALQHMRVPLAQGYWLGMPSPGMDPLAPHRRGQISRHRPAPAAGRAPVAALVEPLTAVTLAGGADAIAQAFAGNAGLEHVTVLDAGKRPVAIVPRHGFFGGSAREREPMRVELGESAERVSRRAMARPFDERFDPVVCCDTRGRYVGVVKVEWLVEGLADQVRAQSL